MIEGEYILVNNSFVDVIVLKQSSKLSDKEAIKMAIDLLKE